MLPKLFVPGSKWNQKHDNVKVGDIGILISSKALAGKIISIYKYCKVVKVLESRDGFVRRVIFEYRTPSLKQASKSMLILGNWSFIQIFHPNFSFIF